MGTGNALYMLMTGARIDARCAYELGFLQEVVPQGQALSRALELEAVIASYPNFPGICADRHAVLAGLSLDLDDGLLLEADVVRATLSSDEIVAGLGRFASGARRQSEGARWLWRCASAYLRTPSLTMPQITVE